MIRFYNGRLLTMDGSMAIRKAELWTGEDKISYIGPERPDAPKFDREIDLDGNLLMPSFKDAHTHSAMTFCRTLADDMPLQEWLFQKIFPMEDRLTPERVYMFNKLAVLEYLAGGITASFDMYWHRPAFARSNVDCGFRAVVCGTGGSYDKIEQEYTELNACGPLISYIPGFHAEYTASQEDLEAVTALAGKYHAPVFAHNSETKKEVEECIARHGVTPTRLMENYGMFEYGGGGFHCVHFSEEDMEIFASHGCWAVTNPCSNAKLASGVAPLTTFMEKGIPLALGTDGPSSNNALDFFREMYLASMLQKLRTGDASACPAEKVLEMATVGAARCMGLTDCDVLAPGKQADLMVIDMHQPNMQPENDIVKNLVYSGSRQNVALTMCAGKILYERGLFFIGEEPERIYAESARMRDEMLSEM